MDPIVIQDATWWPPLPGLSTLGSELADATGLPVRVLPRPKDEELGATGGGTILDVVYAWLPHAAEDVVSAAAAAAVGWLARRWRRGHREEVRILGPDGEVLRVVKRPQRTKPPIVETPETKRESST